MERSAIYSLSEPLQSFLRALASTAVLAAAGTVPGLAGPLDAANEHLREEGLAVRLYGMAERGVEGAATVVLVSACFYCEQCEEVVGVSIRNY